MPRRPDIDPGEPGRERVLEAARELFAADGFEATSIAAIGRRARISKSVLYHYFQSKREVYAAILEAESRRLVERVESAVPADPDAPRLRPGLDALLGFLSERPAAWRLLYRDPPADAELRRLHARIERRRSAALTGLLSLPDKRRRGGDHVELVAVAVSAYIAWWHDHPRYPREAVIDAIMNVAATPVSPKARRRT